jgi:hypothetical protein
VYIWFITPPGEADRRRGTNLWRRQRWGGPMFLRRWCYVSFRFCTIRHIDTQMGMHGKNSHRQVWHSTEKKGIPLCCLHVFRGHLWVCDLLSGTELLENLFHTIIRETCACTLQLQKCRHRSRYHSVTYNCMLKVNQLHILHNQLGYKLTMLINFLLES